MEYYKLKKTETFLISQKALIVKDNKVLVLRMPPGKENWSSKWGLPGGLLEMNENFASGLKRELKEETNLSISVGDVFAVGEMKYDKFIFRDGRKLKTRIIEIAYKCKALSNKIILSHEHTEYKWADLSEIKKLKFYTDSQFAIKKYLTNYSNGKYS